MTNKNEDNSEQVVEGIYSAADGLSTLIALVAGTIIGSVLIVIWKYEAEIIRPIKTRIGLLFNKK